jgi:glyoxylase-like metal-dependent hydrolase (beta-lactamase superfamily II)
MGARHRGRRDQAVTALRLEAVAPGVLLATSRRDHTTSTVVVPPSARIGASVLLVDPAWEPDELRALGGDLATLGSRVAAGLSTHAHYDHLLWHPSFGDAPRYASAETVRRAVADRQDLLDGLGSDWPTDLVDLFGAVTPVRGPTLPWDGPDVELVIHDAHIPGHTAAWIPSMGLLIAGDMLSDVELPLPHDAGGVDPLDAYAAGLDRLAPYVEKADLVIPGHGSPTTRAQARLDADRRYIDDVGSRRASSDPRLSNPGMEAAHAETLELAEGGRGN